MIILLKKLRLCSFLLFICLYGVCEQGFSTHTNRNIDAEPSPHYIFAYLKESACLPSSLFLVDPGEQIIFLRADVYDGFENTVLPATTFTIPEKGAYLISYGASVSNAGTGLELQVNGSSIPGSLVTFQKEGCFIEMAIILRLEEDDLICLNNPIDFPPLLLVNPTNFPFNEDTISYSITEYCAALTIVRISP